MYVACLLSEPCVFSLLHSDSKHPGFIDRIVIGKRLSLTLVRRYLYKNGDSSEGVVGRRKRISLRRPCPQWAEEELVLGRCCHLRENAVIVSFALDWIARRVFYGGRAILPPTHTTHRHIHTHTHPHLYKTHPAPFEHLDDGAFAASGCADERHHLAGVDIHVEIFEDADVEPSRIPETHVIETNLPAKILIWKKTRPDTRHKMRLVCVLITKPWQYALGIALVLQYSLILV